MKEVEKWKTRRKRRKVNTEEDVDGRDKKELNEEKM